ncbi:CNOT6L [Cordylochernes scorpioides]|uniref:CNOT6L n=1 Tax=Cordylochernes scorpioides TaxID=51811 RepID=A0ABY6KLJ3_9ARAC|nr:CNOT6L [Cordylochernes scorpioides]
MLAKVGQQRKNATSGRQRSTKGNNRTGGQSNCQNGCRSTGIHVIYHPTCDPHTSVQNDHQQATERAESKSSSTVTMPTPHTRVLTVRLQWCRERSTWNCADWGRIVFSDESHFLLCPDDCRKCVWRRPGQRVDLGLTVEHHTGPQQGVMVWGAISFDSRTHWRLQPSRNVDYLTRQLETIWQEIPQHTIRNLYQSMTHRVAACIQAKQQLWGGWQNSKLSSMEGGRVSVAEKRLGYCRPELFVVQFEDAELQALLDEDSTQIQEKLAKQLQVSQGAVSLRLNSLGITQKLSRWVPHKLSERQQERRLTGVVYFVLLKPGIMVNTSRYEQQMYSLREALNEKRPEWREKHNNLILQQDNAPAHNATVVKNTIKDLGWEL